MKLNSKFALIVTLTVILVLASSGFSLLSNKKIQEMKEYQYTQLKTQTDLSSMIMYLYEMDGWDFRTTTAYREWEILVNAVKDDFDTIFNAPLVSTFDENFQELLKQTKTLWDVILGRVETMNGVFKEMESINLPISIYTYTEKDGIHFAYEKLPENPMVIHLVNLVNDSHDQVKGIRRSYITLKKINRQMSIQFDDILRQRQMNLTIMVIIDSLFTCLVLALLIALVTNNVTKRIIKVKDMTSVLAEKDFTVKLEPKGSTEMVSLMVNINEMIEQIKSFFEVVKISSDKAIDSGYLINDSADDAAAATAEIDENINSITEKFEMIKSVVTKTVQTIEDMNLRIETLVQNNSNQTNAIERSSHSLNQVVQTLEKMNKMAGERSRNAEEINALVADGDGKISTTSELLRQITDDLDEVKEVVDIINNVAEQTNLLSMNAAIESAHAGEAGKGFSVVAEEIRSLAESTSENATKIAKVIKSIVDAVGKANVSSTEASTAFIKVSSHVDSVVVSLKDISSGIEEIDSRMQQIKGESQETSNAANQINTYCGELAQKQNEITEEVKSVNETINDTMDSIRMIKAGTEDIVSRMQNVSESSKENYNNMTELEKVLSQFKTSKEEITEETQPQEISEEEEL